MEIWLTIYWVNLVNSGYLWIPAFLAESKLDMISQGGADLKKYLSEIMAEVRLPRRDFRLLEADVREGVKYLMYNTSLTLEEAFERIGYDIFGSFYMPPDHSEWYPLDSAAKVYPLSMTTARMSMYRISANMDREVVPELLQLALHAVIKRFPTFATILKRGIFWHYLDARRKRFVIEKEEKIPCSPIKLDTIRDQVFRLVYFKNRISLEVIHCVSDGYGGMALLKTLLAEYMRMLGVPDLCKEGILNIAEAPCQEELVDAFPMVDRAEEMTAYGSGRAIQIRGKRAIVQPAQIIHFHIPSAELMQTAKSLGGSVTCYLLSAMFLAAKAAGKKRSGVLRIQVPVNMRQYYPIKTLRNFSMYATISIPYDEVVTMEELIPMVDWQLKAKITKRPLDGMVANTLGLVCNPLLRRAPLFLKGFLISQITNNITRKSFTAVLSNLGNDSGSFGSFVKSFEAIPGPCNSNQVGCGIMSYNDTAIFSITKPTHDHSFEAALYKILTSSGLTVTVSGNY